MEKKYLKHSDVDAHVIAFDLSNYIWKIVVGWDWFAQKTVGMQFVNAVDSISANIAEGYGRYHKKDKIKFYRYSQGSMTECLDWLEKSRVRKLITEEQYSFMANQLEQLRPALARLINYTNDKLKF